MVVGLLAPEDAHEPQHDPYFYGELLDRLATDSHWFDGDDEIDNGFW